MKGRRRFTSRAFGAAAAIPPIAIAGTILSTLHQSSLGGVFLISPYKMSPLWYSPLLPLFFFVSAVGGGLSMVIFESVCSSKATGRGLEKGILDDLGRVAGFTLEIFVALRVYDLVSRGGWSLLSRGLADPAFQGEIALFAAAMLILATPRLRRTTLGLSVGSLEAVAGVLVNRWNVALTSQLMPPYASYSPAWTEWAITVGLVALALLAYTLAVKILPVFPAKR